MKEIRKTSQFKKDYKRFKNDKEFVETLMGIVKLLAEGNQIPEEYNPHSLKGNWKNYMECHIENDTLLIWFDKNNNVIELVRLGSHSELFGKGRKRRSMLSSHSPCYHILNIPHSSDDKCRAILQWGTIQAVLSRKSGENYL